jgi:peptide deformylase
MKLPQIITIPHPLLRQTLQPVTDFNSELAKLSEVMISVMQQAEGVGLAANQIGVDAQIFVYGLNEPFEIKGKKYPPIPPRAVVNPTITVIDDTVEVMEEGCLSIPNLWGPVGRPIGIQLRGQTVTGQLISENLYGYEARVVQHEVDHLNGRLFLDYITDPTKLHRGKD